MIIATSIVAAAVALALQVEGAGPTTISDGGRAVGIGQMWPCAVAEANRIARKPAYTLADRTDPAKVKEMCRLTLEWHLRRNPRLSVVTLASRWRNPRGGCPRWHLRKLERANAAGQTPAAHKETP